MSSPSDRRRGIAAAAISASILLVACAVFGPQLWERLSLGTNAEEPRPPAPDAPARRPSGGPPLSALQEIDKARAEIDAESGGRLVGPSGRASVEVPSGALSSDTTIEIARLAVELPEAHDGFAFDLRPDGLAFRKDVEIALRIPDGIDPSLAQITVYDPRTNAWVPEPRQTISADGESLVASVDHFSLRRIRVRPGMEYPGGAEIGRATFYLESDAGNSLERYVEGRWSAVRRGTGDYRELMKRGRLHRKSLIGTGRLRAVTGARPRPEVFRNHRRTVAMPSGAPAARTGWVRLTLLDAAGEPTSMRVVARVNDFGPGPTARNAGVILDMSRATAEALGLEWGRDFGLADKNPDLAWIKFNPEGGEKTRRFVEMRVEPFEPLGSEGFSCRLR